MPHSSINKQFPSITVDHPSQQFPDDLIENVAAALKAGMTHYVDVAGIPELRALIAQQVSTPTLNVSAEQVLITAGIQEARFLTLQVIASEQQHVIFPEVVHPGVSNAVTLRPVATRTLPVDNDSLLVPVDVVNKALSQENAVFLENPGRFSGATYTADELKTIANAAANSDSVMIWDQGLAPWSNDATSVLGCIDSLQKTTVIADIQPGFGLENLQLGFVVSSKENIAAMTSLKQVMSICTSTISQLSAIELIKQSTSQANLYDQLKQKHDEVLTNLNQQGYQTMQSDSVSTIAFHGVTNDANSDPFIKHGEGYGLPGCLSLTIHPATDVKRLLDTFINKGEH